MSAGKRIGLLFYMCFALVGCARLGLHRVPSKTKPAQEVILGSNREIKDLSDTHKSVKRVSNKNRLVQLQDILVKDGIKLIHQGEDYLLVLPSDKVFYSDTPRIKWKSYKTLDAVAEYLSCFPKVTIKIAGYTDNVQERMRAKILSRQQARNVSDYLFLQNIDVRFIYAEGYGITMPIASNHTPYGRSTNRRVEISFRRRSV